MWGLDGIYGICEVSGLREHWDSQLVGETTSFSLVFTSVYFKVPTKLTGSVSVFMTDTAFDACLLYSTRLLMCEAWRPRLHCFLMVWNGCSFISTGMDPGRAGSIGLPHFLLFQGHQVYHFYSSSQWPTEILFSDIMFKISFRFTTTFCQCSQYSEENWGWLRDLSRSLLELCRWGVGMMLIRDMQSGESEPHLSYFNDNSCYKKKE